MWQGSGGGGTHKEEHCDTLVLISDSELQLFVNRKSSL